MHYSSCEALPPRSDVPRAADAVREEPGPERAVVPERVPRSTGAFERVHLAPQPQ